MHEQYCHFKPKSLEHKYVGTESRNALPFANGELMEMGNEYYIFSHGLYMEQG
jgi:hypothetical protein